jgi:hypothetical protein
MIIYAVTSGNSIWKDQNTLSVEFVPTKDISNKECYLKVEQFYMNAAITTAVGEQYTPVRCNLTQPLSQAFVDGSATGPNNVIFIRNIQSGWPAPPILVYVADGPQQLTFTFETQLAEASKVKVGMLISLVAASN